MKRKTNPIRNYAHSAKRQRNTRDSIKQQSLIEQARANPNTIITIPPAWISVKSLFCELIHVLPNYLDQASDELRSDDYLVCKALDKMPHFLYRGVTERLYRLALQKENIILHALQKCGLTLRYVWMAFTNPCCIKRQWVEMALEQNPMALEYVPYNYCAKKQHESWYEQWFHKCFDRNPMTFCFAPEYLRNRIDVATRALDHDAETNAMFLGPALLENKSFILDLITRKKVVRVYRRLSATLQQDVDIQQTMVEVDPYYIDMIPYHCLHMKVLVYALKQDGLSIFFQINYLKHACFAEVGIELVSFAIRHQFARRKYSTRQNVVASINTSNNNKDCRVMDYYWRDRPLCSQYQNELIDAFMKRVPVDTNNLYSHIPTHFEDDDMDIFALANTVSPIAVYNFIDTLCSSYEPSVLKPHKYQLLLQRTRQAMDMDVRACEHICNKLYEMCLWRVITMITDYVCRLSMVYPNWRDCILKPLKACVCCDPNSTKAVGTAVDDMSTIQGRRKYLQRNKHLGIPKFVSQIMERVWDSSMMDMYMHFVFAFETAFIPTRLNPHFYAYTDVRFE